MSAVPAFGIQPPAFRLPADACLGPVHLQVADLSRSVSYYCDVIGLQVVDRHDSVVQLGAVRSSSPAFSSALQALVVLHEHLAAMPVASGKRFGLFHLAILLPSRAALGQFLVHLASRGKRAGMSDHAVSEALYLTDPDGHGLEIYADRPRADWQSLDRQLRMGTDPLDARSVMAAAHGEPWSGAPAGTVIGHVHLHVGTIDEASRFYHDTLGFDKTVWDYPGALFLAAGGYHHHVGTNTWARNATAPSPTEAHLLEWTLVLHAPEDLEAVVRSCETHHVPVLRDADTVLVRDPWGTAVRISVITSP